jgi:ATP-dependent DNA helicase RecG
MTTAAEFQALLDRAEGANVEFKSAAGGFHFEDLIKYCVALANEGGGSLVLGVSDRRPRQIVGTRAFAEPGRTEAGFFEKLGHRIAIEEHDHHGERVLLVRVPPRLPGTAWQYQGSFWMRAGDALVPMSDDQLRRIHAETGPDFSAQVCENATIDDLDPEAIDVLRRLWQRKTPEQDIASRPVDRLLADAELLADGQLYFAALILLGTRAALGRHLGQAEIVFEYRSNESPGPAADRREFRCGFPSRARRDLAGRESAQRPATLPAGPVRLGRPHIQ